MREDDNEWWSSLQTVSSFDNGSGVSTGNRIECEVDKEVTQFCPSSLLVESLIGQLCKLIEKDPKNQKELYLKVCEKLHQMKLIDESYEMEEFESMRSYYQKALYQLVSMARNTNKNSKKPNQNAVVYKANRQICLSTNAILEWSRYATEYEEMDFIARGGFGQVFKARHKLDGEVYAVKKIYLRYINAMGFMQNLAEVKMLARLNHPNIVTYKAAWLEPVDPSQKSKQYFHNLSTCDMDNSSESKDSSGGIVFESSDANEHMEGKENFAIVKPIPRENFVAWRGIPITQYSQEWACLYIQMQLCEFTLRQWLDERNMALEPVREPTCLALFKNIVQGVEYIHSQGIVHHDIKPSNVFVSSDLRRVQVGDFGLACSLLTHNPAVAVLPSSSHSHQGHIGTRLYTAPEQLNSICTAKSDIYSLGIVLMELIQPFHTDMERSKVIGRLKAGHIASELGNVFPTLVRIIRRCICHSPNKRPTARELVELLENEDNSNKSKIIAEKDEMIRRLNEQVIMRETEIAELKRLLAELSPGSSPDSYGPPSQFL